MNRLRNLPILSADKKPQFLKLPFGTSRSFQFGRDHVLGIA
ncbi:hypothetical protein X741_27560 [Mesorhizobium sp. LNHC229A00]|nr:hypothetical protein X741_27560 [Mesorhizobium sp. LNHC229A00]